jgi:peroxiredoxin
LQQDYARFQELNTELLAISVQESDIGKHVSELLDLQYPVLSDVEHKAVDAYGVYDLLGDSFAAPAVFVIDLDGVVRWVYVGESSGDRPSNEMILDHVEALSGDG